MLLCTGCSRRCQLLLDRLPIEPSHDSDEAIRGYPGDAVLCTAYDMIWTGPDTTGETCSTAGLLREAVYTNNATYKSSISQS